MEKKTINKIIHYVYVYLKITLILTLVLFGLWFFLSVFSSVSCANVNLEDISCIQIITFDFDEEPNEINLVLEVHERDRWRSCSGLTQLVAKDYLIYKNYSIKSEEDKVFVNNMKLEKNEKFEEAEFGLFFFIDPWIIETHEFSIENLGEKDCLEWSYENRQLNFHHLIGENIYGWWFNFYLIPIFIIIWWYDRKLNKKPKKGSEKGSEKEKKEELK